MALCQILICNTGVDKNAQDASVVLEKPKKRSFRERVKGWGRSIANRGRNIWRRIRRNRKTPLQRILDLVEKIKKALNNKKARLIRRLLRLLRRLKSKLKAAAYEKLKDDLKTNNDLYAIAGVTDILGPQPVATKKHKKH